MTSQGVQYVDGDGEVVTFLFPLVRWVDDDGKEESVRLAVREDNAVYLCIEDTLNSRLMSHEIATALQKLCVSYLEHEGWHYVDMLEYMEEVRRFPIDTDLREQREALLIFLEVLHREIKLTQQKALKEGKGVER